MRRGTPFWMSSLCWAGWREEGGATVDVSSGPRIEKGAED